MKTQVLISTFFVTIVFAKANAADSEADKAWIGTADRACQLACQQPTASSSPTRNFLGFLERNCYALCSCKIETNLPDEIACIGSELSFGFLESTEVSGKCAKGKCVPLTFRQRR